MVEQANLHVKPLNEERVATTARLERRRLGRIKWYNSSSGSAHLSQLALKPFRKHGMNVTGAQIWDPFWPKLGQDPRNCAVLSAHTPKFRALIDIFKPCHCVNMPKYCHSLPCRLPGQVSATMAFKIAARYYCPRTWLYMPRDYWTHDDPRFYLRAWLSKLAQLCWTTMLARHAAIAATSRASTIGVASRMTSYYNGRGVLLVTAPTTGGCSRANDDTMVFDWIIEGINRL